MNPDSKLPHAPLSQIPAEIGCAQDYETLARGFLAHASHEYIAGGCGQDRTVSANLRAFSQWSIYPRLLRDVSAAHTRLALAGENFAHPVFLAPVAFQKLAHAAGEIEVARAAQVSASCLVSSTLASCSLEDIALSAGPQRWFQLYLQSRQRDTLDLVRRAETAGYSAIVLTLDAAIQVASQRARVAGFRMPAEIQAANLSAHAPTPSTSAAADESRIFQGLMKLAPGWSDLDWLISQTRLPVWVKGVMHPADALALRERGVAGMVVSNHGGRSLDGAPASLDTLPAIRAALGREFPLLLDSGIRSGSDIFKALALGANAVMTGRLQMYALSVAGALGVAHMIRLLREELEVCMAMAGCATLADITQDALLRTGGE